MTKILCFDIEDFVVPLNSVPGWVPGWPHPALACSKQPPPPTRSCKDLREDWSRAASARNRLVSSANWSERDLSGTDTHSVWIHTRQKWSAQAYFFTLVLVFSSRFSVKTKDRNSWISFTVKEKAKCDTVQTEDPFFLFKVCFLCLWVLVCFCK